VAVSLDLLGDYLGRSGALQTVSIFWYAWARHGANSRPGRGRLPREEAPMSDLIKGLIYVRDPLTLFALSVWSFSSRFKTRRVPELFLRPCWEKADERALLIALGRVRDA